MSSLLEALIIKGIRLPYAASRLARTTVRRTPRLRNCQIDPCIAIARTSGGFGQHRKLHTTPSCLKKGGSKASKKGISDSAPAASTEDGDPNDFSELQEAITKVHASLKEGLSQLRAGGKFNPESVENLRVSLEKGSKNTVRLSDLAQCVPRGRTLNIIAGEQDHTKAISSAILNSDLNLTPQVDLQNPLQLNIQLPTPTAESRQATVKTAVDLAAKANDGIRNARGAQQKKLRSFSLGRAARPDDLKKAGDRMEKVVTDGGAEVKRILDAAKRMLESG